jgi:hypothetical protein
MRASRRYLVANRRGFAPSSQHVLKRLCCRREARVGLSPSAFGNYSTPKAASFGNGGQAIDVAEGRLSRFFQMRFEIFEQSN